MSVDSPVDQALPLVTGRRYGLLDRLVPPWRGSLVAAINARFRARETTRPGGGVLDDPYALALAGTHPALRLLELAEGLLPAVARMGEAQIAAHCVRHAAIDALVRVALADGVTQVVVIGAGYDMRSVRIGGGRWFEVDRPAMVRAKQAAIRRVALGQGGADTAARTAGEGVIRIAADVGSDDILARLVAAGLDPAAPVCFVLEGIVHYLPRDRVLQLLLALAGPRRQVILSWIEPEMSRRVTSGFREVVRVLGEVPRTFFTAAELEATFRAGGLTFAGWSYAEQVERFAPTAAGRRVGLTQEVGVAKAGATIQR